MVLIVRVFLAAMAGMLVFYSWRAPALGLGVFTGLLALLPLGTKSGAPVRMVRGARSKTGALGARKSLGGQV